MMASGGEKEKEEKGDEWICLYKAGEESAKKRQRKSKENENKERYPPQHFSLDGVIVNLDIPLDRKCEKARFNLGGRRPTRNQTRKPERSPL